MTSFSHTATLTQWGCCGVQRSVTLPDPCLPSLCQSLAVETFSYSLCDHRLYSPLIHKHILYITSSTHFGLLQIEFISIFVHLSIHQKVTCASFCLLQAEKNYILKVLKAIVLSPALQLTRVSIIWQLSLYFNSKMFEFMHVFLRSVLYIYSSSVFLLSFWWIDKLFEQTVLNHVRKYCTMDIFPEPRVTLFANHLFFIQPTVFNLFNT